MRGQKHLNILVHTVILIILGALFDLAVCYVPDSYTNTILLNILNCIENNQQKNQIYLYMDL